MEKKWNGKNFFAKNGSWMALFLLAVVSTILNGKNFLSVSNILNLLRQVSMLGLATIGVNFIIIAGCKDLSVGGIAAVCSMIAAFLSPYGTAAAIIGGTLTALLLGTLNGFLVAVLKILPFIATLGTMIAFNGIALLVHDGKSLAISENSAGFEFLGRGLILNIPFPILIFVVTAAVAIYVSKHTRYGRAVYAIGGNEESAVMMGIQVAKTKMLLYIFSGLLAGFGGIMMSSRLNAGIPFTGKGWDMYTIAAVVMGGTLIRGGEGKISGAVAGILIWGIIQNMINMMGDVSTYWQQIIMGFILLGAVIVQNIAERRRGAINEG